MNGDTHLIWGDLPMCPGSFIRWCWRALLTDKEEEEEPSQERVREASLLHADWSPLRGLQVLNIVSTYDILADEGRALTKVMAAAGAEVEEVVAEGSHCVATLLDSEAKVQYLSWWCRMLNDWSRCWLRGLWAAIACPHFSRGLFALCGFGSHAFRSAHVQRYLEDLTA